jgi:hypothetical protein
MFLVSIIELIVILRRALTRPLRMLILNPVMAGLSLYLALIYEVPVFAIQYTVDRIYNIDEIDHIN